MTTEEMKRHRWFAVYGAFVAAQAMDKIQSGRGAPTDEDMVGYVEEAIEVANMAEKAAEKFG